MFLTVSPPTYWIIRMKVRWNFRRQLYRIRRVQETHAAEALEPKRIGTSVLLGQSA
ncbi:hypothetical protein KCP76_13330 [Salmonella enterica subsp. enterica serovar Weltevreden]|nr:hypothetical protein KCP76_13330 [Salmonella enterica subsp. enterica serovar Weltevreden]